MNFQEKDQSFVIFYNKNKIYDKSTFVLFLSDDPKKSILTIYL